MARLIPRLLLAFVFCSVSAASGSDLPSWQRVIDRNGTTLQRVPVVGRETPVAGLERTAPVESGTREAWALRFSAANAILQDIDFADAQHGFAAGELGLVYRTTNGGTNWQPIMNLGFPYYWYGIDAITLQDVIVSGFNNQTGEGIVRWTHDGGSTWGSILTAHPTAWLDRVRFGDGLHGAATTIGGGQVAYTANSGQSAGDWARATADPSGGWFAGNFTFLDNLRVFITGIRFCRSTDGGASWLALPSADPVFDGAAEFLDASLGYTGGGSISPSVQGWIHRTTDGGNTWSPRLTVTPYPVRTVRFGGTERGWAAGGNIYSGAGGIYGTTDGGDTWGLEMNTGAEMRGLALVRASEDSLDVWCCGYTAGYQGRIYQQRVYLPEDPASVLPGGAVRPQLSGLRSYPNPFSPATTLTFSIARPESVVVEIFDPSGRVIRRMIPGFLGSGTHRLSWDGLDEDGSRLSSGVFYYRLQAGQEIRGGTLVLVR